MTCFAAREIGSRGAHLHVSGKSVAGSLTSRSASQNVRALRGHENRIIIIFIRDNSVSEEFTNK